LLPQDVVVLNKYRLRTLVAPVLSAYSVRVTTRRTTVRDAAELLGVSEHAIRQRIRRNTLKADKDEDGRVHVYLDLDAELSAERPPDGSPDIDPVHLLQEQNRMLREQLEEAHAANRENRRIIAGLVQRVPELEAASEPRDAPVSAAEDGSGTPDPPQEEQVPWWRRLFGM
jgi:hypothetical protein